MTARRLGTSVQGWILVGSVVCLGVARPDECRGSDGIVKKDSWVETMLATRAQVGQVLAEQERALEQLKLSPWYRVGPIKAKSFKHALWPERKVDITAKNSKGNPVWQKHANWEDGVVHRLRQRANRAATYLYRTITTPKPTTLKAYFGSDDGIVVWLNDEKILSRDVARGPGPNQDQADLKLKAGENRLLLKIYNRTGDHGYYFSIRPGMPQKLWSQLEKAYPTECQWMRRDLPGGKHVHWFRRPNSIQLEQTMIASVLESLGEMGTKLKQQFEQLEQAKASAEDARWLALYEEACGFREALADLKTIDLKSLRLAVEDLTETYPKKYAKGAGYLSRLDACEKRLAAIRTGLAKSDPTVLEKVPGFVREVGALRREALLANPLLDFETLLVVKRRANRLGLPQNWQGNCAMSPAGYDNELMTFSPISPKGELKTLYRPPSQGFIGDVELHFDADKILFSAPGSHRRWQIWEMRIDGSGLRQVTPGEHPDVDNYDACYLPNGRIIFASTRCFQGIPCVGGGNTVANLCIMDADGKNIRQLCFDQDHNWCPTVMNNGRVLFSRWEYSDTPHYFSRLLFSMNPDGTNQMEYYGSNSFWPNSMFYSRPIPGHPTKVVTVVSGHHGVPRMGEMILLDPAKGRHEASGAIQRIPGYGKKVEPIIRDQLVNASWPKMLHPFPLGDHETGEGAGKYFLVSCKPTPSDEWAIYLVDIFDNMLLLKEVPGYALFEPVPVQKVPTPRIVPEKVDLTRDDAVVYLSDIYYGGGLRDVPRGTVKELRIFEFHYTYPRMGGHKNVGVEGPWDVHRIVGTVPVFEDGSAVFKVPANTPLAVQPLDEKGRAIQVMRSWFVAMPGETLSCVGCHEHQSTSPPIRNTMASYRKPVEPEPWYGPTRGFSFKRDVQEPVLNKYCIGCHNGKERPDGKKLVDLSPKPKNGWGNFTPAYLALHPYVRRPGPESDYSLQFPYEWHASTSELIQMMEKGHQGVKLDEEAWDRLYTWIDLNVPDHGTWSEHRKIPHNYHQRRLEMRTRYANRPEDPEVIPKIDRPPVKTIMPECSPKPEPREIRCDGWPFDAAEAKRRQAAAGPKTRRTIDLGEGVKMDLVLVPAGTFVMGGIGGPKDMRPRSVVMVDKPFWMGAIEVTNRQYACFDPMHDNGHLNQHHKDHTTPGYPMRDPDLPAMRVNWQEAVAFCEWLSKRTGEPFTLPTEAQWEWACRAGSASPSSYGDLDADFGKHANLADASMKLLAVHGVNPSPIKNPNPYQDFLPKDARFNDGEKLMARAGKYQPNAWGLHDMHGNVWEWTRSTYRPYPYRGDDGRNEISTAGRKVVRGGSWYDRPKRARSAFRLAYLPYQRVFNVGIRVVCPAKQNRVAQTGK